jgi:diaminopimelate decarboxylase
VKKIHSHIGAGSDPTYWLKSAQYLLDLIEHRFPHCEVLNLGGGFKVARGDHDKLVNPHAMGLEALKMIAEFNKRTGRNLRAEIEPGSFLVANSGILVSEVMDMMTTKHGDNDGYNFIKLNTGLNDLTRPALYGAQHSIKFLSLKHDLKDSDEKKPYVVVGHCCESGDLLTCDPNDSNELREI